MTLDGDLFQHTPKLQEIDFSLNELEHVGHNLLAGLASLTVVDFSANPCISEEAETPEGIQELNLQLPIKCPPLN